MFERLKHLTRTVEFWLYSAGSFILNYAWLDPTTGLMIYSVMPTVLQELLPQNLLAAIGVGLFMAAVLTAIAKKRRRHRNEG